MEIVIAGPNLQDQSEGSFQVHKPGCRHLLFIGADLDELWEEDLKSQKEVVYAVYKDQIEEGCPYESAWGDIYFAPCVSDLPSK